MIQLWHIVRVRALVARFAVPDKIFGLTPFLNFVDRCTQNTLLGSATGGARCFGPKQARYQLRYTRKLNGIIHDAN